MGWIEGGEEVVEEEEEGEKKKTWGRERDMGWVRERTGKGLCIIIN